MRFVCPYCKADIGTTPRALCPRCGKGMRVPAPFTPGFRERLERRRQRSARQREVSRQTAGTGLTDSLATRKPAHLVVAVLVLALAGGMLLARARSFKKPTSSPSYRLRAQKDLDVYRIAAERFRQDCGRYPGDEEGLGVLRHAPWLQGWQGPYVNLVKPDPWERAYSYTVAGGAPRIRSGGPDRTLDTADDLAATSFTPEELADLTRPPDAPIPPATP